MTVARDVNLVALIPLAMFLLAQTVGAVWWAATMTARFESLQISVHEGQMSMQDDLIAETAERIDDRRRIYDRIVGVEAAVTAIGSDGLAVRATIDGLSSSVNELRADVRITNQLLRDALTNNKTGG